MAGHPSNTSCDGLIIFVTKQQTENTYVSAACYHTKLELFSGVFGTSLLATPKKKRFLERSAQN
jgi:hypothetical protein